MPGLGPVGQRLRLITQLGLHFRKVFTVLGSRGFGFRVALDLVERGRDDFLLAFGDLLFLFATAATAATRLLGLRVVELERHGLDEVHIGLGRVLAILRGRVNTNDVARHQLVVFHRQHGGAIELLRSALLQQRDGLFRRAVDGVVERQFLQRILVLSGNLHGDFFDGADFRVAAGFGDLDRRRRHFPGLDEVIVRQADHLTVVHHAQMIRAVLLDVHRSGGPVILRRGQIDRLPFFEQNLRAAQGAIRFDFQLCDGAFHGAQIAAGIFRVRGQTAPGGINVRDFDVLDGRQVDGADLKRAGFDAAGFHVILDIFRERHEQKSEAGAALLRLHGRFFPLGPAGVTSPDIRLRSGKAAQAGRDQLIGLAPHRL